MEKKYISDDELKVLAKKHNTTSEKMNENIKFSIKELVEIQNGIEQDIARNNYVKFPNDLTIFGYGENNELNEKYLCYTPNMKGIIKKDKKDIAIVSGFGATNTPTVGTLSMILKLIELQNKTNIYTYLIINDLGTINARNIEIDKVLNLTEQYKKFIIKMGFDLENGEIRTHNDINHARVFSLIASTIKLNDFISNKEVTDDTYDRLNLRGNDFSVLIDHTYTAADVLLPIIKDKKSNIIVSCGLEEYYHANIGKIALNALKEKKAIKDFFPKKVEIGAIYGKLIDGFFPYFKQSKSIPNSSVNLGDTNQEIYNKIINSSEKDQKVILEMIELASNFSKENIKKAKNAFELRAQNIEEWNKWKKEYYDYFISIKKIWDSCENEKSNVYEKLFY